jgi:hypothetical protein
MDAMSICLNGRNYVTWFSAKGVEFDGNIDFGDLESLGRSGTTPDSQLQEIIRLAYPQSKPDLATVVISSRGVMMKKLDQFISYINPDDGARSLVMPKKKNLIRVKRALQQL